MDRSQRLHISKVQSSRIVRNFYNVFTFTSLNVIPGNDNCLSATAKINKNILCQHHYTIQKPNSNDRILSLIGSNFNHITSLHNTDDMYCYFEMIDYACFTFPYLCGHQDDEDCS